MRVLSLEARIKHCTLLRRLGEEAQYKKFKCYVLLEDLSEKYFADLLSGSFGCR